MVAVAFVAPAALAQTGFPADLDLHLRYETREMDRWDLSAEGQFNCLDAVNPPNRCPMTATGIATPLLGVLILDDVYQSDGVTDPMGSAAVVLVSPTENADAPVMDAMRGANWHRASGGEVPDVIVPGRGQFLAWHGRWDDSNGDGIAQIRWQSSRGPVAPRPGNEWAPVAEGGIVSYVEPGSHPAVTNRERPEEETPDLVYRYSTIEMVHKPAGDGDGRVLFLDGSLFRSLTVETVSFAFLAPSEDGKKPFTASPSSLVDIDRYATLAPGPVAAIFGSALAPLFDRVGSPSIGHCPNGCRAGPVPLGGTPLAEPGGETESIVWAPYREEWREGSGSTRAGLHPEHLVDYEGWIDLRLFHAPWGGTVSAEAGPLPGRGADGNQSMLPGVLAWEVRTGVWRDLDGDGFIGSAREGDPYEKGSRPIADDYANPVGEFFGDWPTTDKGYSVQTLYVVLTPKTDWGRGVVILGDSTGMPVCQAPGVTAACYTSGAVLVTGSTPVTLYAFGETETPGRYVGRTTLLMPEGSPGLTACTLAVEIEYGPAANRRRTSLADCDVLAPLAPPDVAG